MTAIVSVKINDGIVLASDSASTFTNTQIYDHAEKIANLVKELPIGVAVTGDGGIGSESLTTLLKESWQTFGGQTGPHVPRSIIIHDVSRGEPVARVLVQREIDSNRRNSEYPALRLRLLGGATSARGVDRRGQLRWSLLSEQNFRIDKWSVCRG
jgi:hypothetical protein